MCVGGGEGKGLVRGDCVRLCTGREKEGVGGREREIKKERKRERDEGTGARNAGQD